MSYGFSKVTTSEVLQMPTGSEDASQESSYHERMKLVAPVTAFVMDSSPIDTSSPEENSFITVFR